MGYGRYFTRQVEQVDDERADDEQEERPPQNIKQHFLDEMQDAEQRAWESLAKYRFHMFGYYAAVWNQYNMALGMPMRNPFFDLVAGARRRIDGNMPHVRRNGDRQRGVEDRRVQVASGPMSVHGDEGSAVGGD